MDEPTASLSADEAARLFRIVRELAEQGVSILYVSHRLDEVTALCDRVTVFKDGRQVATFNRDAATRPALMRAIVGADMVALGERSVEAQGARAPILEVRNLRRLPAVRDVSFELGVGEVLGLAGLVGAGRTETARLIFGADRLMAGEMRLDGKAFRPGSTYAAVQRGVALVPEERRSQGLILRKSVAFNINLAIASRFRLARWLPLLVQRRANIRARDVAESLSIQPRRTDVLVNRLSGGNQQKVVMGKWLDRSARVLILDEPTRGVDVGARVELHRIIRGLADGGLGVIMISSDFEELLGCDRVLVMAEGEIRRELRRSEISEQTILEACYGHAQQGQG
jgi:ribose transport system ATP-binding protein/rhamnose transport system ATP-binding protein